MAYGRSDPLSEFLSPAMGRVMIESPESLIPLFVKMGLRPQEFEQMTQTAALGDALAAPPALPPPANIPTTALPPPEPVPQWPEETPYTPPPEPPPDVPTETYPPSETMPGPADALTPTYAQPGMPTFSRPERQPGVPQWRADPLGYLSEKYDEYLRPAGGEAAPMGVGERPGTPPTTTEGAARAAGAPEAAAAPPMTVGTPWNTYGKLGGLYPLAVPSAPAGGTRAGVAGRALPGGDARNKGPASAEETKKISDALSGVRAPPAPPTPRLHPEVGRAGAFPQGSPIASFLASVLSGQASGPELIRLLQAVPGGK